jgi:DNA-binding transcriptional MocR family regulator
MLSDKHQGYVIADDTYSFLQASKDWRIVNILV